MHSKKEVSAMSLVSKKGVKLAVLSVIGLLTLTGCGESADEVYSKPSNYDEAIIKIEGSKDEIHHNLLSLIYDAMHEGSVSSKVLDNAMYRYASSVFGIYDAVALPDGSTETTLEAAVKDIQHNPAGEITGGGDTVKAFIKAHRAYWYYNEEGKHIKEDKTEIADGEDWIPGYTEFSHVESKWNAIESRIAEEMYAKVSGGSYTEKNYFSEEKLLKALHEDGKKVRNYLTTGAHAIVRDQFIIPSSVEKDEVFDTFTGYDNNEHVILHREYYQSNRSANPDAPKATYIEDEIVPTVYNDLLIEQYLLDEDVAAVRNSRARKINVIKIEKYSSFHNNADMLVKELVKEIYTLPDAAVETLRFDADEIEEASDTLFQKYALVSKGLYDEINGTSAQAVAAKEIVTRLQAHASDLYEAVQAPTTGVWYYKNTTAGDLAQDYEKLATQINGGNWDLIDSSKYSTFTSNGTRSPLEGYSQQYIDIMQKQSITKGWYIQSKTPSLDSNGEINDRLFKLSIANAKIEVKEAGNSAAYEELRKADRLVREGGAWKVRDEASEFENRFLCSINGAYYLKFDGKEADAKWTDDIVYDDGNAYYIVQVLEAAKDSKLRSVSQTNYAHTRSQVFMDQVIDEVAKIVGETGNYATLSKNHWLEKMDLKYYDQKVYDYFKSNYPDLFDEE